MVKYIVTIVFILQMLLYNAVVLYLPSMATSNVLGIPRQYSILLLGFVCVLYSGMGGLKAVIWTDLFQAISMVGALLVIAVLGTLDAGGIAAIWREVQLNGRDHLDHFFELNMTTRHTLFSILVGSTLKHIYLVGVNQVQIQRALSLPTLRQGQLAFVWCSICGASIILLASYLGAVLVAAYRSCDPFLAGEIPRRDSVLVHYVGHRLSSIPGIRGLFVAAIFSATLSTLSSFSNSMAALAIEDFVQPLAVPKGEQLTDKTRTWLAKTLAMGFGVACVLAAQQIEKANSRLLQLTTTMMGAVGTPFVVSFGLGIFTRFVNSWGILVGLATTISLGSYITIRQAFFQVGLEPSMPIYYDANTCSRVFNGTMPASSLEPISKVLWYTEEYFFMINQSVHPNNVDQISYMTLPVVEFVMMLVIAPIVSLLTGGWKQQVDDEFLVESMQKGDNDSNLTTTCVQGNLAKNIVQSNESKRRPKCVE